MSAMLEKMARAIAMHRYSVSNPPELAAKYADEFLDDYILDARAALQAIREPDEEMVVAGCSEISKEMSGGYFGGSSGDAAHSCFTAMIDHILQGMDER